MSRLHPLGQGGQAAGAIGQRGNLQVKGQVSVPDIGLVPGNALRRAVLHPGAIVIVVIHADHIGGNGRKLGGKGSVAQHRIPASAGHLAPAGKVVGIQGGNLSPIGKVGHGIQGEGIIPALPRVVPGHGNRLRVCVSDGHRDRSGPFLAPFHPRLRPGGLLLGP